MRRSYFGTLGHSVGSHVGGISGQAGSSQFDCLFVYCVRNKNESKNKMIEAAFRDSLDW
jgi:hypothetical protein